MRPEKLGQPPETNDDLQAVSLFPRGIFLKKNCDGFILRKLQGTGKGKLRNLMSSDAFVSSFKCPATSQSLRKSGDCELVQLNQHVWDWLAMSLGNGPVTNSRPNNVKPGPTILIQMNAKKYTLLVVVGLSVAAITAYAAVASLVTFRTTGVFVGVTQGTNPVTGDPQYDQTTLGGWNLVNLAMGRSATKTNVPNQVLAMTIDCDLSAASLVVYDLSVSNIVNIIATTTSLDSVKQEDAKQTGPNRARFVAQFQIAQNGNPTNGLLGGYLTVSGQIRLNPTNSCPETVSVGLDCDSLDSLTGNMEVPAKCDPCPGKFNFRAGLTHLIGVVDAIDSGNTNSILVQNGSLSIRNELSVPPPVTPDLK